MGKEALTRIIANYREFFEPPNFALESVCQGSLQYLSRRFAISKTLAHLLPLIAFCTDEGDSALVFRFADFAREGVADFFEAGKIPQVGEIFALLRFHWLHGASFAFQKNAGAIRLFHQRQALVVVPQPRVFLDELVFGHALVRGEA